MTVRCPLCGRKVDHIQLRTGRRIDEFICPACHRELMTQKSDVRPLSQREIIQRIFEDEKAKEQEQENENG